jgi:hypothetical protein
MTGNFLMALMALPFYIFACYYLVKLAYRLGKKRQWRLINRILIAIGAFIAFNTPVGSTFIPGLIVMPGYCENAGFTLYKTPEQWMLENPGVASTLVRPKSTNSESFLNANGQYEMAYHLNQRFDWRILSPSLPTKNMFQKIETVVDVKTEEVMAKRIDYSLSAQPIYSRGSCFKKEELSKWEINNKVFGQYISLYKFKGEEK